MPYRGCKQNNAHSYAKGCYLGAIVSQVVKARYAPETDVFDLKSLPFSEKTFREIDPEVITGY